MDVETTFNFVQVAGEHAACRAVSPEPEPAREKRGEDGAMSSYDIAEQIHESLPGTSNVGFGLKCDMY
jgi:hypothetical protein